MDDHVWASDADRDRAAMLLRVHFAAGRLTPDELDDRLAAALAAATLGDLRRALADLPESAPERGDDSRLERGYRRLLAFYPARYRRVHEEEILAVLMTGAAEGKRRPSLAEAADLIMGALRVRCQPVRGGLAGPGWRGIVALMTTGATLGLLAGVGYAVHDPPMPTGAATVLLPPITRNVPAPAMIADSEPVLSMALRRAGLDISAQTLRGRVQAKQLTDRVVSITAQGNTAHQALTITNAVAQSYLVYAASHSALSAHEKAEMAMLDAAAIVPGTSLLSEVLVTSGLGVLCGTLLGAIGAAALSPSRRRVGMT